MEFELLAVLIYVAIWTLLSTLCWIKCRPSGRVMLSPLFFGVKLTGGRPSLRPNPRPWARYLNIAWMALFTFSFIEFYYVTGATVWLRYFVGAGAAAFVPIIPGVTLSFQLFLNLLPAIFIAVLVHEALHALTAVLNGLSVKGFGIGVIMGLIPVAFVELDENELRSASRLARLGTYSAGVAGNAVVALLIALALLYTPSSVVIVGVADDSPAEAAGLKPGMIIVSVNGVEVHSISDLQEALKGTTTASITIRYGGNIETLVVQRPSPSSKYGIMIAEAPTPLINLLGVNLGLAVASIIVLTRLLNEALALINAAPLFITDGAKVVGEFSPKLSGLLSAVTLVMVGLSISLQKMG